MKDYKINALNDKELFKNYISNENIANMEIYCKLELIYNLYNYETQNFIILNKSYDKNNQKDIENGLLSKYIASEDIEELSNKDIFITWEWELCNKECIDIWEYQIETSKKNDIWKEEAKNDLKYKNYDNKSDFKEIILKKELEEYYKKLKLIWLKIIWVDLTSENKDYYILSYLIQFNNSYKNTFIINAIKYLETKIDNKWPVLSKLWSNLLDEIVKENENQWREWNGIYIKWWWEDKFISLLYLLLLWKIELSMVSWLNSIIQDNYRIDIIDYWKEEWIYFNENNWEVFKDWVKLWKMKLWKNPYKFFKFLYDNIWVHKTNKEIVKEGIGNNSVESDNQYITWIKKDLEEPIKNIIEAWNWWYIIRK